MAWMLVCAVWLWVVVGDSGCWVSVVDVFGVDVSGPFSPPRSSVLEADVAEGGRKGWVGCAGAVRDLNSILS